MEATSRKMLPTDRVEDHGDFTKTKCLHGPGDLKPYSGSDCIVQISNLDNVHISKEKLGQYDFTDICKVTIGEESGFLSDLFDRVLMTMTEREVAYIVTKENGRQQGVHQRWDKSFRCNVNLKSIEHNFDIEGWLERKSIVDHHFNKATEFFNTNKLASAIQHYRTTLELVPRVGSYKLPKELLLYCKDITVQCHLNVADCMMTMNEYKGVIKLCNAVLELDATSVKALNLRGDVYAKQQKYSEAQADFVSVLNIDPHNMEVQMKIVQIAHR